MLLSFSISSAYNMSVTRKGLCVLLVAIALTTSCTKKPEGILGKPLPPLAGATGVIGKLPKNIYKDVVLVHFFSLTSIVSREMASEIEALAMQHARNGLRSIFVLSPEYSFDHGIQEVGEQARSVVKNEAVLLDGNYKIWGAFGVCRYGCTVISKDGIVVFESPKTKSIDEIEEALLAHLPVRSPLPPRPGDTPPPRPATQIQCGYISGRIGNCGGNEIERVFSFTDPKSYKPNTPYLEGTWYVGPEMVWHTKANEIGRLSFSFRGGEVFAVLKSHDGAPAFATVWVDGEHPKKENAGKDLQGQKVMALKPRIYGLLKGLPEGPHTLTLETVSDNLVVYSFEVR